MAHRTFNEMLKTNSISSAKQKKTGNKNRDNSLNKLLISTLISLKNLIKLEKKWRLTMFVRPVLGNQSYYRLIERLK
jgi:hypothetical protein